MGGVRARVSVVVAACLVPVACSSTTPLDAVDTPAATSTAPGSIASTPDETPTSVDTLPSTDPPGPSPTTEPTVPDRTVPDHTTTDPDGAIEADMEAIYESATPLVGDDVTCELEWTELTSPEGEVTFARDGHLFSFDPESGELHCLADVDRSPLRLDWNPAGDTLLVDQDLVVTAEDQHPSGFEPGTTGISWSQPAGTALIAPDDAGTALRHVNATDPRDETDVASLDITWAAAYHPSGLAIASAGIDDDGLPGLFLADNQGNDPRSLVFLEDPATRITEVAFSHNGEWITFVHDHTEGTVDEGVLAHVHRLHLGGLWLEDLVGFTDVVPSGLIASEQLDGTIAWMEPRSTVNTQTFVWNTDSVSLRFPETVAEPVGFFDRGAAVAVVRPVSGAGAGAGDEGQLWMYPPGLDPVLVARGVTAATTRTMHHPNWTDPPLDIEQQAVG